MFMKNHEMVFIKIVYKPDSAVSELTTFKEKFKFNKNGFFFTALVMLKNLQSWIYAVPSSL